MREEALRPSRIDKVGDDLDADERSIQRVLDVFEKATATLDKVTDSFLLLDKNVTTLKESHFGLGHQMQKINEESIDRDQAIKRYRMYLGVLALFTVVNFACSVLFIIALIVSI